MSDIISAVLTLAAMGAFWAASVALMVWYLNRITNDQN